MFSAVFQKFQPYVTLGDVRAWPEGLTLSIRKTYTPVIVLNILAPVVTNTGS